MHDGVAVAATEKHPMQLLTKIWTKRSIYYRSFQMTQRQVRVDWTTVDVAGTLRASCITIGRYFNLIFLYGVEIKHRANP
jgi:hypothetical protein